MKGYRTQKKREQLLAQVVLAAAAYILAWAARETAAYFFPGLLLLVWLPSRSWRGLAVFCLASGLMAGAEWLYFWLDTGSILGRLGITTRVLEEQNPKTLAGYLLNFLNYGKLRGLLPVFLLILAACAAELRAEDPRRRALAVTSLLFVLFTTYMPAQLSPLELVHPIGARYWCAGAPLGLLTLALWLSSLRQRRPRTARAIGAALLAGFAVFPTWGMRGCAAANAVGQFLILALLFVLGKRNYQLSLRACAFIKGRDFSLIRYGREGVGRDA
jgi:hypothetical protein